MFLGFPQAKTGVLIQDGSLHFSFIAPRELKRLTAQQLATYNPSFIYMFTAKNNNSITCFISQTQHLKKGSVTKEELSAGLVRHLEEQFEKYTVQRKKQRGVGTQEGIQIEATYRDNNRSMKHIELITASSEKTTFVNCSAPVSEYNFYKPQFDTMVSSFKISNEK